MTNEFKREDRYLVIKRKDLGKLSPSSKLKLGEWLEDNAHALPQRQYVVVESDWAEYETVFKMIEARVTGIPTAEHAEIIDLHTALAERGAEIERLNKEIDHSPCLYEERYHALSTAAKLALDTLKEVTALHGQWTNGMWAAHIVAKPIAVLTAALESK